MLPILVLREIFSFLSVKERAKCRALSREWKKQVDWYEEGRDNLVFHTGFYPLNKRWSWTNGRGLIRIENSFQIRSIEFFKNARTISKLKNLKNLKKIKLLNTKRDLSTREVKGLQNYLTAFEECEELEIEEFGLLECTRIKLPKLKLLVLKLVHLRCKLEIDCPALEVLISWVEMNHEVTYRNLGNLKHLEATSSALNFASSSEQFPKLESISFFNDGNFFQKDLLSYMPSLKRLILYTSSPHFDYRELMRQKKRYKLDDNLQMLINGFDLDKSDIFAITSDRTTIGINEQCINEVYDFYPRMVDSKINWVILLKYDLLYSRFKIVPADWFSRFWGVDMIWLQLVPSDHHLTGFLKHCPALDKLILSLAEFSDARLLDLCFSLTPSIRELAIYEDDYSAVRNFDYSFLYNLRVDYVRLHSIALPINFLRAIFRTCKHLVTLSFHYYRRPLFHLRVKSNREIDLRFVSEDRNEPFLHFDTLNKMIKFLKNDQRTKFICLTDSKIISRALDKELEKEGERLKRALGIH